MTFLKSATFLAYAQNSYELIYLYNTKVKPFI